jgi:hypothetical protein
MTYSQLARLEHSLRDKRVLSVYLQGGSEDPATRLAWRTDLDRSLRDLRRWLTGSPHGERTAFERCLGLLEGALAPLANGLSSPGYVAFVTDGVVHDAEPLLAPAPTIAIWSTGLCVAPYIRALKETHPVIVALVDARSARVYRYQMGELTLLASIHAHATIDAPAHMGDVARHGFHPGVRGETAHDAAQRAHEAGTARMLRETEALIARHGTLDTSFIVGGSPRVASRLRQTIIRSAPERVLHLDSLDIDVSEAEIIAAARSGASLLRDAVDRRHISAIVAAHGEQDAASLGPASTRQSLEQHAVRDLYITSRFLQDNMAEAEELVRAALDQGATVEHVSREAAERLDAHGGLAARLRYRVRGGGVESEALAPNAAANGASS